MKTLLRSVRALSPWLSLVVALILIGILMTLGSVAPHLFCAEMNPGGKEFICGPRYTHAGIRLLQLSGISVWVLLLVIGGAQLSRDRTTRSAVIAWLVSALLLVGLGLLWLSFRGDEGP
jgi:hypothetical protein